MIESSRRHTASLVLGTAIVAAGLAYMAGRARASGPSSQSLTYSGVLEIDDKLAEGPRSIQLHLWDDPLSTEPEARRCSVIPTQPTVVTAGRFEIPFSDVCTDTIRSSSDLYIEVVVEGESLSRTRLGAVPYAIEAMRARDLTPELKQALVPPGMVVAFAGPTAPAGWLTCNGAAVGRAEFPELFAAIGTSHGSGDGATTFNLPDYRGRFLRGTSAATGRDPDAASRAAAAPGGNAGDLVGSIELTATANHSHAVSDPGHYHYEIIGNGAGAIYVWTNAGPGAFAGLSQSNIPTTISTTGVSVGTATGVALSTESRPENAGVVYIVKF